MSQIKRYHLDIRAEDGAARVRFRTRTPSTDRYANEHSFRAIRLAFWRENASLETCDDAAALSPITLLVTPFVIEIVLDCDYGLWVVYYVMSRAVHVLRKIGRCGVCLRSDTLRRGGFEGASVRPLRPSPPGNRGSGPLGGAGPFCCV
ncbi:unnamed protein product, partial [Iphiclides podalirius]